MITRAAEGFFNVSVSQVELKHIQFYDGITTTDIHETIIKSAADLISEETPDYQYLAARLSVFHLRKAARWIRAACSLWPRYQNWLIWVNTIATLMEDYTAEFEELDAYIDHKRDFRFSYAAVKQLEGKYFVQNRVTKKSTRVLSSFTS